MSTRLEKFIQNNRDDFDSAEINKNVWDKIESNLNVKQNRVGLFKIDRRWWAAAASIIIFVTATIYFISKNKKNEPTFVQSHITLPSKNVTDAVDTIYSSEMNEFAHLIEIKQVELKNMGQTHPQLYKQFIKDINILDSTFNILRSALPANPNKEMLMETMVKNLQLQLDLLNRQLQIIKQLKQKNTDYENKTI